MEKWMTDAALNHIAGAYGLRVRAMLPMRSVVGLVTDHGRLMCKRYAGQQGVTPERLNAIAQVKEQLAENGIGCCYLRAKDGQMVLPWDHAHITIEPWVIGRHADFSSHKERLDAVKAVARLHQARVKIPFALSYPPTLLQKLAYRLERADEVAGSGRLVGITQAEWRHWRRRAEVILRGFHSGAFEQMMALDREKGILCHRDLAPHNILVRAGMSAQLIDFDLAGLDSPVYDLYQLFGHMAYFMRGRSQWQESLIAAYARIGDLSRHHLDVLHYLDGFPAHLLREIGDIPTTGSNRAIQRVATRIRFAREVEEGRVCAIS